MLVPKYTLTRNGKVIAYGTHEAMYAAAQLLRVDGEVLLVTGTHLLLHIPIHEVESERPYPLNGG